MRKSCNRYDNDTIYKNNSLVEKNNLSDSASGFVMKRGSRLLLFLPLLCS